MTGEPASSAPTGWQGIRAAMARAREDHYARMVAWPQAIIRAAQPRWVIVVGAAPAGPTAPGRWQVAAPPWWQVTANVVFAFVLLLASALITRGLLGKVPLMPIAALGVTAAVLKAARVQVAHPASDRDHG